MTNVDQATATPSSAKKERSPNFPFITLTKALERTRAIYSASKRYEARLADVAAALGSGAKSSGTLQTVSAMLSFGLLEDSGSGEGRKFRVSDLGFKALEDHRHGAKETALAEAALKPKLIAEYADTWSVGRPSDPICISELRIDRGFTEDGAKAFLRVFDDAISYAPGAKNDKENDAGSNGAVEAISPASDGKIEVGDLVQWESSGVLRLEKPTPVRAIQEHEGQMWVFVDGSETGIAMEELILDRKAPSSRSEPPTLALGVAPLRQQPTQLGMDEDRFTVDEGVVRVEFPKGMGADSVGELDEFFKLFIKKATRRATAG